MKRTKDNICNYHSDIAGYAKEILSNIDYHQKYTTDKNLNLNDIVKLAENILRDVEYARIAGLAMESRLARYRQGIEDLGFIRNKE